jgi:hypothetical protein
LSGALRGHVGNVCPGAVGRNTEAPRLPLLYLCAAREQSASEPSTSDNGQPGLHGGLGNGLPISRINPLRYGPWPLGEAMRQHDFVRVLEGAAVGAQFLTPMVALDQVGSNPRAWAEADKSLSGEQNRWTSGPLGVAPCPTSKEIRPFCCLRDTGNFNISDGPDIGCRE